MGYWVGGKEGAHKNSCPEGNAGHRTGRRLVCSGLRTGTRAGVSRDANHLGWIV